MAPALAAPEALAAPATAAPVVTLFKGLAALAPLTLAAAAAAPATVKLPLAAAQVLSLCVTKLLLPQLTRSCLLFQVLLIAAMFSLEQLELGPASQPQPTLINGR